MTPASLFRIYSMTKPVTAVAVMQLFEAGKFKLDDPVAKYLPAFDRVMIAGAQGEAPRRPSRAMTVQDLLLHTSGLSHRTSDLYRTAGVRSRSFSMDTFIDNITRAPLMEEPGTRFRYSEATTVLGRLVEVWSGQSFESFLATNLFAAAEDGRHCVRRRTRAPGAIHDRLCAGTRRRPPPHRDRRGAVHRAAQTDRRRSRTRVDRARLPALLPDVAQRRRTRWQTDSAALDRRTHDDERPVRGRAGRAWRARWGGGLPMSM